MDFISRLATVAANERHNRACAKLEKQCREIGLRYSFDLEDFGLKTIAGGRTVVVDNRRK